MADHAVHVAAADEEAVLRLAEPLEVLAVSVAGLGQHADLIALGFQQTADDGSAKAGVVHIGIAAHHHKVQLLPPAGLHIGPADGKKFGVDLWGRVVHLLISSFLVEHGQHPRPLRQCLRIATSPKGRGLGSPCKVSGFARGSPFGRAGREAA